VEEILVGIAFCAVVWTVDAGITGMYAQNTGFVVEIESFVAGYAFCDVCVGIFHAVVG